MNRILKWMEKQLDNSFPKFESYYFAFLELKRMEKRTKKQEFWYRYCAQYCMFWQLKRSFVEALRRKINDKIARKSLKEFYQTHKPPYSNEDKCLLISLQISVPEGREMLAKAMLEPIRNKSGS